MSTYLRNPFQYGINQVANSGLSAAYHAVDFALSNGHYQRAGLIAAGAVAQTSYNPYVQAALAAPVVWQGAKWLVDQVF